MARRPLITFTVAAAVATLFAFATPAHANSTITINPGNVPTTAASAQVTHECGPALGGGSYDGKDVWVFNLPGNHAATGDFVSVTATFTTPGGSQSLTVPTDGGGILLLGTSKAWIAVNAGWTLTGAAAVITGAAPFFVLTHTCPADTSSTPPTTQPPTLQPPTPTVSASPSPSVSATPGTPSPSTSPASPTSSATVTVTTPASTTTSPVHVPSGLPTTGVAVTGLITLGAGLIVAGIVLLTARRRRDAAVHSDEQSPTAS